MKGRGQGWLGGVHVGAGAGQAERKAGMGRFQGATPPPKKHTSTAHTPINSVNVTGRAAGSAFEIGMGRIGEWAGVGGRYGGPRKQRGRSGEKTFHVREMSLAYLRKPQRTRTRAPHPPSPAGTARCASTTAALALTVHVSMGQHIVCLGKCSLRHPSTLDGWGVPGVAVDATALRHTRGHGTAGCWLLHYT